MENYNPLLILANIIVIVVALGFAGFVTAIAMWSIGNGCNLRVPRLTVQRIGWAFVGMFVAAMACVVPAMHVLIGNQMSTLCEIGLVVAGFVGSLGGGILCNSRFRRPSVRYKQANDRASYKNHLVIECSQSLCHLSDSKGV